MICSRCGNKIPDWSNFCPACGSAQTIQQAAEPYAPAPVIQYECVSQPPTPQQDASPAENPTSRPNLPRINKAKLSDVLQNTKIMALGLVLGCIVGVGLYIVSAFLGSFVNVMISRAVGYQSFSTFRMNADGLAIFLILATTLANHIFFGWLTAGILFRFEERHDCRTQILFDATAAVVLFLAATLFPAMGLQPGILTYVTHVIAIRQFGKSKLEQE